MSINFPSSTQTNQASETAQGNIRRAVDATGKMLEHGDKAVRDARAALYEGVEAGARITKEYAQHATDVTMDAVHQTTDTARDLYQTASQKAGDSLETSKQFVRRNPVPVVVGAVTLGLTIGYLIMRARGRIG